MSLEGHFKDNIFILYVVSFGAQITWVIFYKVTIKMFETFSRGREFI